MRLHNKRINSEREGRRKNKIQRPQKSDPLAPLRCRAAVLLPASLRTMERRRTATGETAC